VATIQKSASPLVAASLGNYAARAASCFFSSKVSGPPDVIVVYVPETLNSTLS
jgi:hypothetical protein